MPGLRCLPSWPTCTPTPREAASRCVYPGQGLSPRLSSSGSNLSDCEGTSGCFPVGDDGPSLPGGGCSHSGPSQEPCVLEPGEDGFRSGAGSCPVDPGIQGPHLLQDELACRPQAVMSWVGMHHPVALGVTCPSGGVSGAAEQRLAGILQLRLGPKLLSTQFFKGVAHRQDAAHSGCETRAGEVEGEGGCGVVGR